jgi:hypothetical protein
MTQNATGQLAGDVRTGSVHPCGANQSRSGMASAGASTAIKDSMGALYFAVQS